MEDDMQVGDRVRTDLVDDAEELEVIGITEAGTVALAAEQGAWVRALRPGVAVHVGVAPDGILIHGEDGRWYQYEHLESVNVHENQTVPAGRPLGQVGLDPGQRGAVWITVSAPTPAGDGFKPIDPTAFLTFEQPAVAEAVGETTEADVPEQAQAAEPAASTTELEQEADRLRAAGFTVTDPPASGTS